MSFILLNILFKTTGCNLEEIIPVFI